MSAGNLGGGGGLNNFLSGPKFPPRVAWTRNCPMFLDVESAKFDEKVGPLRMGMSLVENGECACSWLQKGSTTLSHKKTATLNQTLVALVLFVWRLRFPTFSPQLDACYNRVSKTEFLLQQYTTRKSLLIFKKCQKLVQKCKLVGILWGNFLTNS